MKGKNKIRLTLKELLKKDENNRTEKEGEENNIRIISYNHRVEFEVLKAWLSMIHLENQNQ